MHVHETAIHSTLSICVSINTDFCLFFKRDSSLNLTRRFDPREVDELPILALTLIG